MRLSYALVAALIVCATVSAQSIVLPTTLAGGNGQSGNMFDLVATNTVSICSFDVVIQSAGSQGVEVYALTGGGSHVGNETNGAAWTMIGTTTVTSNGAGVVTPLNLGLGFTIPAGMTQAFYVTCSTGGIVSYTNGTAVGSVSASDANLQFLEGTGNAYAFGGVFMPRIFNGNIIYEASGTPTCLPPPPLWAVNSGESSTDVDGVTVAGPFAPGAAITNVLNGGPSTATLTTSLVGNGFELAISLEQAYDAATSPGFLSPGSQAVNFNFGTATFLNGGAAISFQPHPGTVTFPVSVPGGVVACGQMGVVDPASLDSFTLSQCSQVTGVTQVCVNSPTATNTGAGDDTSYTHTFAAPFTFYGMAYADCFVNSNGNITFGSGSTDFTETEAEMLSQQPRIAPNWSDYSPNVGGQVNVEEVAGVLTATWFNVPNFGAATTSSTFCASLDTLTGTITVANDLISHNGNNDGLVGISPGGGLSLANNIDLSAALAPAAPYLPANPTDAIYEDFTLGANGPNDLQSTFMTFTPAGIGVGPYILN